MIRLGIDTGGSSLKAAPVDVARGALAAAACSFPTPTPATPAAVAGVVRQIAAAFPGVEGPIGFGFPAVVKRGVACTAANARNARATDSTLGSVAIASAASKSSIARCMSLA